MVNSAVLQKDLHTSDSNSADFSLNLVSLKFSKVYATCELNFREGKQKNCSEYLHWNGNSVCPERVCLVLAVVANWLWIKHKHSLTSAILQGQPQNWDKKEQIIDLFKSTLY